MRGLALVALLAASTSAVHAQTVGVTLVPSAQRIQWSDKLAFDEDYLYGGRLALQFGKFVELQPFYFTRDNYGIDSTRAAELFGPASLNKQIDLRHYGTNIQFNFSDGVIVPFARVGAGVLRLKPDSAPRQDRITVGAGGGLRFGIGGLNAEIFAEQMGFRMNPRSLFGPDTAGADIPTLRNFVYGAAVTIPLTSMPDDYQSNAGLRGTSAPLEPFVGVLRYAGENQLPDQELAGVRAGIDFTPEFGVRGFYWRGVNDDRDATVPVTGYGGEAQFNLNTGPGISPYLIVGAGRIDYGSDFVDSLGVGRVDKTAFILGGGASLRLTDRLRLNGAIRDYVMTVDDDLDAVGSTKDITHNTMLTAGLTISFGGRAGSSETDRARTRERESRDRELRELRGDMDSERERRLREQRLELDERERRLNERMREGRVVESERVMRGDTIMMRRQMEGRAGEGRWITIPVPMHGEIILRYGFPTGDSTRRDSVRLVPGSEDLAARLADLERRLMTRMDAIADGRTPPAAAPAPTTVYVAPRDGAVIDERRAAMPVFSRLGQTRTSDLRPYVGLGFGDGNTQLIGGLRADLGPINPTSGFHFVPELAVGLGSGPLSVLAMANLRYAFGSVGGENALRPYATVGGGIFSPTVLGINTAVGSSFAIGEGERPLLLNVELQGINLFKYTRINLGLSRSF